MSVVLRPAGDRGALLEVPEGSAPAVARLLRELVPELVDVVPGHCTVVVTWGDAPPRRQLEEVASGAVSAQVAGAARVIEIPVAYDGPDLSVVSELSGLSVEDVIAAHQASEYTAAFLGYAPGFAYLVGGDARLHVARRTEPRQRVPSGSVAVAGVYSGVYPREGPGGWRIIGTTPVVLFDAARPEPALIAPGDRVRFVAT